MNNKDYDQLRLDEYKGSDQKEREEMSKLHIKAARAMLSKALQALQRMPVDELRPTDINKMIEISSKLERLSRDDIDNS